VQVKLLRGKKKRSAQWLSDRTEKLGLKMTRQAIADLESGRRRYVTTAELVILAVALNTSPVLLLYPGGYDAEVELTPGVGVPEFVAAQWFSGHGWINTYLKSQYPTDEEWEAAQIVSAEDADEFDTNIASLSLERELFDAKRARDRLMSQSRLKRDREQVAFYDRIIERLQRQLGHDGH